MLATSPEHMMAAAVADTQRASTAALALPPGFPGSDPNSHPPLGSTAFPPVFERQPPVPAPLLMDTTSNTATGPQRKRGSSKRTSLEAELDLDADAAKRQPTLRNDSDTGGGTVSMDVVDNADAGTVTKDPRAPEKENTIRRRLRGPAAVRNANANVNANANANINVRRGGVKTRKMTAAAAATTTTIKSGSGKSGSAVPRSALAPVPAPVPAPAPAPAVTMAMADHELAVEAGRVGGAASRLLAAARGGGAGAGAGAGPRRVPINSTEAAAAGVPARRAS
jgi:hypothetical protein